MENKDEVVEIIGLMSLKQKLECMQDISANIQILKSIVSLSNAYKTDSLDSGEGGRVFSHSHNLNNEIFRLHEKLESLTKSL